MVFGKNIEKKFALISVFEKKNLKYLCTNLAKHKFNFVSTGSTADKIRSMGFKCKDVSKITKTKEMFNGRVKTLNSLIYSSLLYIRDDKIHAKQFKNLNFPKIDIVVVNLYPFEKFSKKSKDEKVVEMIDIGGPSLLRAASKNYKYITPIIDHKDYPKVIKNLEKNNGVTDIDFRRRMALKIFKETSKYDKIISSWLNEK
tara:strand:- start:1394 stop:1993 length:600 start_codon:yes stop_codon:yes gene_type:complete